MRKWTIFSNHGHVLFYLAGDSQARLRDVAAAVGLTERAVQKIVRDLQQSGMLSVSKHGRRNRYRINHTKTLRHDLEAHCKLGPLIKLINSEIAVKTEPASTKSTKAQSTKAKSTKAKSAKAKLEEAGPAPEKAKVKDPVERQQGSLF